ncbi:DUF4430 domain-containing protein [Aneurinibacillus aneurinilyticus]|uniref:DUF4430 domain-containing protein n=1 Tax=Aneurinibacillus aneurinilyticus TaxID=1391 RepID=UPI002E21AD8C|nr:DUF4430 domain-containing protein [Aneurinibacillus aneurinilyticus]
MKSRVWKSIFSLLLTISMVLGLLPSSMAAAEANGNSHTITIQHAPSVIKVGDKPVLQARVLDANGDELSEEAVVWSTDNPECAAFTPQHPGKLLTLKEGTISVMASLESNQTIRDTIDIKVEPNIKEVYMRIEGYDRTIFPRTKVQIPLYDISADLGKASGSSSGTSNGWSVDKFNNPTNAHAIVKVLRDLGMSQIKDNEEDAPDKFDFQDYGWGLYIAMIGGDREFDHSGMSGWMYAVNDTLPSVGSQGRDLEDGDDIVWYYGAFGFDNVYTKISANKTHVQMGEEVRMKLTGASSMDGLGNDKVFLPVSNATILIKEGGAEYKGKEPAVITDEKGEATLVFNKPGTYEISAVRYRANESYGEETIDIVRPYPVTITVASP